MSNSTSNIEGVRRALLEESERADALRLLLLDCEERRKKLQFQLNRLRREAGEIH